MINWYIEGSQEVMPLRLKFRLICHRGRYYASELKLEKNKENLQKVCKVCKTTSKKNETFIHKIAFLG